MIGYLRGHIKHRGAQIAVVDVQGVGYLVHAPRRTLDAWGTQGEVEAWVSTQVREDAIVLYGFSTWTDREAFETLITVSGVGPKLAMAALSTHSSAALSQAVDEEDLAALCLVPGIGKRTAQRMALELKNKLPAGELDVSLPRPEPESTDTLELALQRLGYSRHEIARVRRELPGQGMEPTAPIEQRLKAALRILYGK